MRHHPTHELMTVFASGELPASLSIAVAAHLELCHDCQTLADRITQQAAQQEFTTPSSTPSQQDHEDDFADMIAQITQDDALLDTLFDTTETAEQTIEFKGQHYTLPRALQSLVLQKPQKLGKLTRSRIDLQEGSLKTSLLHIEPGGSVPMHTHRGFELTLLLDGEFEDEMGKYQKGDFIWLTGEHEHTPTTTTGCLCFTVSNDALQFTQGISKLLNPIGQFIY
ncbi:ChrR family anti-sigma-E factor [Vibrio algivorus]|uniref:Anti-ECF sigma factor ChrR n=1 Tax=Vibrio algivorus TaxID=1667024 RepID=A0ABQ6ET39_9VIBR|nr:ChrR family anti-sigma-E factor [Vibrio algivorus]GLT16206.1 anti-ECF sigma factor ChrR [Vibrio algivorus]